MSSPAAPPLVAVARPAHVNALRVIGALMLVLALLVVPLLLIALGLVAYGFTTGDETAALSAVGIGIATLDTAITLLLAVAAVAAAVGFVRTAGRLSGTQLVIDAAGIRAVPGATPLPWQHLQRVVIVRTASGDHLIADDGTRWRTPPATRLGMLRDWVTGRRYGSVDVPINGLQVHATQVAVAVRDHSQGRFPTAD